MFPRQIQHLAEYFLKFPGVGPKQATRFVFHLLREDRGHVSELARAIQSLQDEVHLCSQCYKTYDASSAGKSAAALCEFCSNPRRNPRQVLVVEKEVDLENIERTRKYGGLYHVLGGVVSPLDSSAPARLHLKELFERMRRTAGPDGAELILATNPTAEGDATALYLERIFAPLKTQAGLVISRLGRGLTTGSELEYADDITVANALENRR